MGRFLLSSILAICLVGLSRSDFASDQKECGDVLIGLATCLPYVQGGAKTPTPDCCSGLKQVLVKSKKCLCVLIKDRDDPNLGIKINATLALKLPSVCGASINATNCIDLLHLAPNSSDAQVFKQFGSGTQGNGTTTGKGNPPNPSSASSSGGSGVATPVNDGGTRGRGKEWSARDVVVGVWIWCFAWLVIICG